MGGTADAGLFSDQLGSAHGFCMSIKTFDAAALIAQNTRFIGVKAINMSAKQEFTVSPAIRRALAKLGEDLSLARRRRRFTQASMAERLQVSVATLRRLEKGDPSIRMGTLAQALFVLGELHKIGDLLDTRTDDIGLSLMNEQLPQRVRAKASKPDSGAL